MKYWKRYDSVFKLYSSKKIYRKIVDIARDLGKPFQRKSKRGRKFSVEPVQYAAYIVFKGGKGKAYRKMELDSECYLGKHIDHSTFGKNLNKIPEEYIRELLQLTGEYLEKLLGHAKTHIPDSTKLSTDRYTEIIYQGKPRKVIETFKLHIMVQRHPGKRVVVIKDGMASDHHVSDSEGAVRMSGVLKSGDILTGDRGYDYEKVYSACFRRGIRTNIKQQGYECGQGSRCRKKATFSERRYKNQRGVVETIFGGVENEGLTKTHYRREDNRFKYGLMLLIRQNMESILRIEIEKQLE